MKVLGAQRGRGEYGSREGQSLVKKHGRGIGKQFVVWHCKDAFQEGKEYIDGVCGHCKILCSDKDHSCSIYKQTLADYKCEDNPQMMPRNRPKWAGPGPVKCAICGIEL